MGKVKKMKPSQVGKNVALADQIETLHSVKAKNRTKERNRHDDDDEVCFKISLYYSEEPSRNNTIGTCVIT